MKARKKTNRHCHVKLNAAPKCRTYTGEYVFSDGILRLKNILITGGDFVLYMDKESADWFSKALAGEKVEPLYGRFGPPVSDPSRRKPEES